MGLATLVVELSDDWVAIGVPKLGAPKVEDKEKRGAKVDVPPIKLCTDDSHYPGVGEDIVMVAHLFGQAKIRRTLRVKSVDFEEGVMVFEEPAPDGCHGAPLIYDGQCVAVMDQPDMGLLADRAVLMSHVLPVDLHEEYDREREDTMYDASRMSRVDFEKKMGERRGRRETMKRRLR